MQRRIIVSNGKRFLVNVPAEDGIGAGFPTGFVTVKSTTDSRWYLFTASGSAGNVTASISQSALSFPTSSYYDLNMPFQLVKSTNNNSYAVYINNTAPTASLFVSQSAYTGSAEAKPFLLLYNITDGNYYRAYLSSSGTTTTLAVDQTIYSGSWIHSFN